MTCKDRPLARHPSLPAVTAVLLLLAVLSVTGQQAHMHVDGQGDAQALLFRRGDRCFAITPRHAMGSQSYAELKVLQQDSIRQAQGDLCALLADDVADIALLTVSGEAAVTCGEPIGIPASVDKYALGRRMGQLISISESGGVEARQLEVSHVSAEHIYILGREEQNRLVAGLSGSILFINQERAGVLTRVGGLGAVSPDEGSVIRVDSLAAKLDQLFSHTVGGVVLENGCLDTLTRKPVAQRRGDGVLDGVIVKWPERILGSAHRPELLVSPANSVGFWASEAKFPARLVIRLSSNEASAVTRVVLDGATLAGQSQLVKDVRVYFRGSEEGPWSPGESVRVDAASGIGVLALGLPKRAREVMLEILSNWGSREAIALSRVRVYPQ